MVVQMLVFHLPPLLFGEGSEHRMGIPVLPLLQIVHFLDELQQFWVFLGKILGLCRLGLTHGGQVLSPRLVIVQAAFEKPAEQGIWVGFCFFVFNGQFKRELTVPDHLPGGHPAPQRRRILAEFVESIADFAISSFVEE